MEKEDFRIAVITVSDRAASGERPDQSGPALVAYLVEHGFRVEDTMVIPDEEDELEEALVNYADDENMDLVLTTGGTGLAIRDITPETTLGVADRVVPGIAEAIRAYSLTKTPNAMLSRGVAVVRGCTLIINIPGSPKACVESMDAIIQALPHALGMLRGGKLDG